MKKKSNNLKKGNYIIENKDKLLLKRKKKKRIKQLLLLVIIMISTLVTLCLKLPYFNISSIEIIDNVNVTKEEISKKSNILVGSNIFYINTREAKQEIMRNPYITNVKIKRSLPTKVKITVNERVAVFYGKANNLYYILDDKGVLLEKRTDIKNMNLVNLEGFNYEKCEIGNLIVTEDNRKINIANEITNIINEVRKKNVKSNISSVDVSDILDIKVFSQDLCIKLGTSEDLRNKFNKALNIIVAPEYQGVKGYIDVSFKGNPVVFVEK